MHFVEIENPSQELLDQLLEEAKSNDPCHDCGVKPGEAHDPGCDIARCLVCKRQRLQCDCKGGDGEIWEGIWPGTDTAYKNRLVCRWEGPSRVSGWNEDKNPRFDLNRAALIDQMGAS